MTKAYEIDLQLHWFCSGDLVFSYNEDMKSEISLFTPKTEDKRRSVSPFLILKRQHYYKIAQLYDFSDDGNEDNYECNELRHPSLVRQDYGLPSNIPFRGDFFGPMNAVNVTRIFRAVQAKLMNDPEVREDAISSLQDYYEEKLKMAQPVVTLAFKRA